MWATKVRNKEGSTQNLSGWEIGIDVVGLRPRLPDPQTSAFSTELCRINQVPLCYHCWARQEGGMISSKY